MGPLVLFDGTCNFCNGSVNFIIRHDRAARFRFAVVDSDAARSALIEIGEATEGHNSVLLIEDGRLLTKSEATLGIARHLGLPWSVAYAFKLVPRSVRDFFYNAFAKRRHLLFGKSESCMVPTPDIRDRFLS